VTARRGTLAYRATRFVRRNKFAVTAAAVLAATVTVGVWSTVHQQRRAERRFQQVRNLAHRLVFDFHDQIRDLPGSTKARQMLVTTALEYLDSLSKDASDDPDLMLEMAQTYERVGSVQGEPLRPSLGRLPRRSRVFRSRSPFMTSCWRATLRMAR